MIAEPMTTTFETSRGMVVGVRPMTVDDTRHLVGIYEGMGEASRYFRFNEALDEVSPERIWQEADGMAQATAVNSQGLIAFADGPDGIERPLGAARFVMISPEEAEFAVSVRDDMQGQGLGALLVSQLMAQARNAGVKRLVGTASPENKAVWGMLRKVDPPAKRTVAGNMVDIVFDLGND